MSILLGVTWTSANELRNYPLADFATGVDTTGSFTLPRSFLIGLGLSVHSGLSVDTTKFYLQGVAGYGAGYVVTVGYADGSASGVAGAPATVPVAGHVEGQAYPLSGLGDFADVAGLLAVGLLGDVALQPAGAFTFSLAGGALDPDCVRPQIRGVSSLQVQNGTDLSPRIYGDVTLVAGDNVRLTYAAGPGGTASITIDAISGDGLTESCACPGTTTPQPILTINGIGPNTAGDFTLTGNACLEVAGAGAGIQLSDTCSQPCCGCPELAALTAELQHLGDEVLTVQNYANALNGSYANFQANVLASRLSDFPCGPSS